ncbi:hypothetical protein F2Q69_00048262 [Brassica cretica]|uniref:RNase H type-1 domain-containing protein n=1 Tax=Brassica cretica TaxID=69181 RepID=A0A8S9PMK7_BRACR|nr:hypothetical protein F2Q69_00048262 [Brassica cretica]
MEGPPPPSSGKVFSVNLCSPWTDCFAGDRLLFLWFEFSAVRTKDSLQGIVIKFQGPATTMMKEETTSTVRSKGREGSIAREVKEIITLGKVENVPTDQWDLMTRGTVDSFGSRSGEPFSETGRRNLNKERQPNNPEDGVIPRSPLKSVKTHVPRAAQLEEIPNEVLEVVREELREVMIQYTSCADPTESAARRERVRRAEEQGELKARKWFLQEYQRHAGWEAYPFQTRKEKFQASRGECQPRNVWADPQWLGNLELFRRVQERPQQNQEREWTQAQAAVEQPKALKEISGIGSRCDMVCRSDAAWNSEKRCTGVAWEFLRNGNERVSSGSLTFTNVKSPLVAEGLALLSAMEDAVSWDFRQISFESDSSRLMKAVKEGSNVLDLHGILCDIYALSMAFDVVSFYWVSRNSVSHVDRIAKYVLKNLVLNLV